MSRDPYCRACGYSLVGLTESSKCPECGRPIVEVLERGPARTWGRRYKSDIVIFGLPLLHIATGPSDDERIGKARGIIAIGDEAVGWLALGGYARGWVALGGWAVGVVAMGGCACGLVALGGGAIGAIALGGGAFGLVAHGGGAIGIIAQGGGAFGYLVEAGGGWGAHITSGNRTGPYAVDFFRAFNRALGASPPQGPRFLLVMLLWRVALAVVLALPPALVALWGYLRAIRSQPDADRGP